jgi:hypothetical protein
LTAFRLAGLGVLLALGAGPAFALTPAVHTVDWYRTHQTEREAELTACQNDHSLDNQAECRNALSGAHAALADSFAASVSTKEPEADPAYYDHNAGVLAMTLTMCSHQQAPLSWCKAAQTASDKQTR